MCACPAGFTGKGTCACGTPTGYERPASAGLCLLTTPGASVDHATKPAKKSSKLLYWSAGAALWAVAGVMVFASYEPDNSPDMTASEEADRAFAERAFVSARDAMKDPTSVKFKNVIVSAKANCMTGQILAKNSYAAYTGYTDFVWVNGQTTVDPGEAKFNVIMDNVNDVLAFTEARLACMEATPIGDGYVPLKIPEA